MLTLVSIFGPICLPPLISPVCAEHVVFSLADLRKDHSDVDIETVAIAYGLIRWMATKKTMGGIQDVEFIHPTALHGILSEDAQYMNQEGISSYVLKKMKGKAQQGCIC